MTHILLDVDGVLLTGRPIDGLGWATDLDRDLGLTIEDLQSRFFKPYWAEIVIGKRPIRPCLDHALEGLPVSAEALMSYWFSQDARIEQDILDAVDQLRGAGVAVSLATNQEPARLTYLSEKLGLGRHFDGVFASGVMGVAKPDPAFFAQIETRLGADPRDLILVDDTPANTAAARLRGWHGVDWPAHGSLTEVLTARGLLS